ncbi:DNA-binding transcriptional regulator, MarR family [Devosia enhydra]|uniref:DNA-binding transcriptional regulator, MarR family n=2 Tax=Devosia enhydra TaxID=665118 RepID=A0A1K2HTW7_9HYPH|nr:DNA-binding transcriptional regulator, MarR family [Devosia enhydra]
MDRCYDAAMCTDLHLDPELIRIAEATGMSHEGAEAVAAIDEVMIRIRRALMRRDLGRQILSRLDSGLELIHLDALWAVDSDAPDAGEMTVGQVAARLEIDPSRASRIVAELVDKGYLVRVASQADARRICLGLTLLGQNLLNDVKAMKWGAFSRALASWPEDEIVLFARLLDRFSTWTTDAFADTAEAPLDEAKAS